MEEKTVFLPAYLRINPLSECVSTAQRTRSPDVHYTSPDLTSFLPISTKYTLTKWEEKALEWKTHWTCLCQLPKTHTHTHTHHLLWPWVLNFTSGVQDGVLQMYTNIDGLITLDLKYQLKMPKSRGHSTTNWQELGVMEGLFTWDVESLDAMNENSPQQWKL